MLICDSSAIIAATVASDRDHEWVVRQLTGRSGPLVVPAGIVAEAAFMVEQIGGAQSLAWFAGDLADGAYLFDCGDGDFARIIDLLADYADLTLGFADAAVAACGERRGAPVLTLDWRDFAPLETAGVVRLIR